MRASFLGSVLIGLILLPLSSGGDLRPIAVYKGGGVIAPETPHQSIRLDSQEVIIRLKSESYVVAIVFNLFNDGPAATEWTGFPKWVEASSNVFPIFKRFEGSVNGTKLKFSDASDRSWGGRLTQAIPPQEKMPNFEKASVPKCQWLVTPVVFPGHAMTTIRVTYEALYYGSGISIASYLFGTGRFWKGNIGKAVFIVDATDVGGTGEVSTYIQNESGHVKSTRRQISENVVKYELKDFKPHFDARFTARLYISGHTRPLYPADGRFPIAPPAPLPVRIKKSGNR